MSLILKREPFKNNMSKLNTSINSSSLKSNKNKSLIDPNGSTAFQLSQKQIHFLNTQLNQVYQISMFVRNVSQKSQQIRLKKPKSSTFTVNMNKQGLIAPGLDVKITITFDNKENQASQDFFTILGEEYQCDIPIHVTPEAGKLSFDPFINFGFIKVGTFKQISWTVTNESQTMNSIKFVPNTSADCKIQANPSTCVLEPKQKKQIKFTIISNEVGHCQGVIDIEPKLFSASNIDFVANFCEFTRMISDDEGNPLHEIQVQTLYAGQEIQILSNLVNNTPKACQYRISRKRGSPNEELNNLITPQQFGRDDSQKLINFTPSQGILEAYSSVQLITKIQAKFDQSEQQLFCNYILGRISNMPLQKEWSYTIKAHINDQQSPLILYLKGSTIIPKLGLSSTFFNFGESALQQKKEKNFKIQNFSQRPIKIQFNKSSNYTFSPKKLQINGKSSAYITVTFMPKIVGQLNQVIAMTCGCFSFPIKTLGKGFFNNKKNKQKSGILESSKVEQLNPSEMDNTFLQNQISFIQDKDKRKSTMMDQSSRTMHFDSYNNKTSFNGNSFTGSSVYLTEQKKAKVLRDRSGKQVRIDSNNFNQNQIIQPYSSHPKSHQQQRLIHRQLTSAELANIVVGKVVIDIGKIFLRSTQSKTFHICNFNSKPMSIQLITNNNESFSDSPSQKQVLPGLSVGGLTIKFEGLVEGDFKHNIQYALNGKHFFEIMVTGTVIQPTLTISRSEIKFFASEQDKTFQKKQVLTLTNSFEYQVEYNFKKQQNSLFTIEPQSGFIKAKGQQVITFSHNFQSLPQIGSKLEQSIKLKITHGKTFQIKCVSFVPECSCICKSLQINFKQVGVGKAYQNKIILKNISKNFTVFKLIIPKQLQEILQSTIDTGSLASQQMAQIGLKLLAFTSKTVQSAITFIIRGGKSIIIPIKANIIMPKLRVQNQFLDFGSTPIEGNPALKQVTFINESQIPVDLQLRLPYDSFLCNLLKINKILDQNSTLIKSDFKDKNYVGSVIKINPKCKSNILFQFTPEQVKDYQFTLPMYIYNSPDPVPQLQKSCSCKGIKNRLMAAQKQINFGKIIIQQNLQVYQKSKSLQIRNPQQEAIDWWVDDNSLYPFSLQINKGKLEGFQKINLKIFFYSDVAGDYSKQLQFFINQAETDNSRQYLKITIKASASYPTLYFDKPYVIMPVVALQQESRTSFEIINGGYQNINLKHMVIQQYSNVDIKINYVQGSNLGVTKKKIKVECSFKSEKPISFTVKLNFYDTNNRVFTIPLSGTADNCLYTMIQNNQNQNSEMDIEKDCNFLRNYINSLGCLDDSLYEFPRSIIQNQFQKMSQFLANYSSTFDKIKSQVKKNPKYFLTFDYIAEVIKSIKSEGGFLNQIRPEFLLTYKEYLDAIRLRAENNANVISNFTNLTQKQFQSTHKKSWVCLLYQIFKVYSRVSVGKTKVNQFWAKFSARQKVITGWLQQAYLSEARVQYQKKKDVLEELNDSQLLSAVISKYTNIKVLQFYNRPVKGLKQRERRIKNIIETFNQIGINSHCRAEDILRSNPKEMLLILEGLYLVLPSYLQKGDPVLFSCSLGQTITKAIQITNPAKHPITYIAKIQGSKAYSIENQTQFVIQSKSTHEVRIKYISNINLNNASATLTLTGKASSKFTPSTFIFVLNSQNLGRISERSVQVTGQLYEQYDFALAVQNNLQNDGQFKVQIISANSNKSCPLAFYSTNQSIKIKKGQTSQFIMTFIPLMLESQKCYVVFKDQRIGQFQYQIVGLVQLPGLSLEVIRIPQTLFTNKKYSLDLSIPPKNDLLLRAKNTVLSFVQKPGKPQKTSTNLFAQKLYPKINPSEPYSVKLIPSNQMICLKTDNIFIKDTEGVSGVDQQAKKQESKVGVDINMKIAAKDVSFVIFLKNASGTDLRKYKVLLTSVYKPLRYELQMKVSVNKTLPQPLPLININAEQNTFMVKLQVNDQSKSILVLDREREVIVPAKSTQNVSIIFRPKAQTTYHGLIKMENLNTGQIIEYQIVAIGEQPETEQLKFQQQIRKQKQYKIKLPVNKNTKCTVTKFTLADAVFNKNFVVTIDQCFFKFKYTPKLPGNYQGKLYIQDQSKIHAFKVVISARDIIEDQIKVRTLQRKPFQGQIKLQPGTYAAVCDNHHLKFKTNFTLVQGESFKFTYYSAKPQQKQSSLIFSEQKLGQITYLLKIKVDQMPQIKFEPFKTELGSIHEEIIVFENTDVTEMKVFGNCSHPKTFYFQPSNIVVPAKSQLKAKIIYKPSSLQLQQGKINFSSDKNSKWNYHLSGYGLLQSKPAHIPIKAIIGVQKLESISFVNPMNKRVQATISLQNLDENVFQLIYKNTKIELDSQQQLILPIMYKPKSLKINRSMLSISISQKINFKYEIVGSCQHHQKQLKSFKMQSRMKKEEHIKFKLPYISEQMKLDQKLQLNLISKEQSLQFENLLAESVKIINQFAKCENRNQIEFQLMLMSYKPFKAQAFFQISRQNGCKWIYNCEFSFTNPPVDDKITIISDINKQASVSFKLTNRLKSFAKFKAYFSPATSSTQFTVIPKSGDLQPFGREGSVFQINFCPTIYKKEWQGKLIIQTQESYWSYDVKGMLTPYEPPKMKSVINN